MIITFNDLEKIRLQHKSKKIVLASGVFDLLHAGHLEYLKQAKSQGDVLVVMVKSDKRVKRYKDPSRPIMAQQDRLRIVDSIKSVNYAFLSPEEQEEKPKIDHSYEAIFPRLKPDLFYSTNEVWKMLELLSDTKVIIAPRIKVGKYESTTDLIDYIRKSK